MVWVEDLDVLSPTDVRMIDELLKMVGPFGEVRLRVKRGELRFAEMTRSIDVKKYEPDRLELLDIS